MERLSVLLTLCEGNPPVTVGSHKKGPVTWSFGISFMLAWTGYYNSKHSSCRWFESSLGLCDVTEWKRFFHWGCGVVHDFQRLIIYMLCIFQNSYFVFYVFGLVWLFNYTPNNLQSHIQLSQVKSQQTHVQPIKCIMTREKCHHIADIR